MRHNYMRHNYIGHNYTGQGSCGLRAAEPADDAGVAEGADILVIDTTFQPFPSDTGMFDGAGAGVAQRCRHIVILVIDTTFSLFPSTY